MTTSEEIVLPAAIRIAVPATAANLGPGFDCLALALELFNCVEIHPPRSSVGVTIEVAGEGAETLAVDDHNLVLQAMRSFASSLGSVLPPFHLRLENAIPLGRGLGSSAAAIVGGLFAAATLLCVDSTPERLLPLALAMESHPDNVVAALYGGLTLGVLDGETALVRHIAVPATLHAVVLSPDVFSSTLETRAVLPASVPRKDAVFNASRCALLVADLAIGRLDGLRIAMQDRLHQPQRGQVFGYLVAAIEAAQAAGAHGAALSGAGTSVIALADDNFEAIAGAMASVAVAHGIHARTMVLPVAYRGAHIVTRLRVPTPVL